MSSNFRKTTSNIFLSAFVALILVSFMFTGNEFLMSSPDEVANVGGTPIRFNEYENEFKRQLEFYKQFMGGKDLTQKQIEQYNLKNNTVNNLVARKLMGLVASRIGAEPSTDQIKKDIKNQPYFKTNEQFDINRYKAVLARAGMTPEDFEKDTRERLKLQEAQSVIGRLPISDSYMQELEKLRSSKRSIQYVSYKKEDLRKHVPVSKEEIDVYLKDENNLKKVQEQFNVKKVTFDKPEQVLASHILLRTAEDNHSEILKKANGLHKKLTSKNFAEMANKHSEDSNMDPQTKKKKGGDLGWFSKGRMVPEFEAAAFSTGKGKISKPVKTQFGYHILYIRDKKAAVAAKFDDYKHALAKADILNSKIKAIDALSDELARKVGEALNEKSNKTLVALKNKFGFTLLENEEVNRLDGLKEENKVEDNQFQELFEGTLGKVHTFKTPSKVTVIKVGAYKATPKAPKKEGEVEEKEKTVEEKKVELSNILNRKFSQNMVNDMRDNTTVKIYSKRF